MLQNRGFGEGKIVSFLHTKNRGLRFVSRKGQGVKELFDRGLTQMNTDCYKSFSLSNKPFEPPTISKAQ